MTLLERWRDKAHAVKCELADEVVRASGKLRLQVNGWSMLPTVWPGDTLNVEHVGYDAVARGDILLYRRDQRLIAHRLIARESVAAGQLLTRGDSMPASDPPVDSARVLGRVASIERDGRRFAPSRNLRLSERVLAALVRRSAFAARVVVGVHGMRRKWSN